MKETRRSIYRKTAKKLAELLYRTFDLLLTRFSVESQFSEAFIKLLLGVQFGLSAATFRSLYILTSDQPLNEQILPAGFVVVMSYACWAFFLTMVALHVDAFVHSERMASKSISYVISCYMTIVYTYVVHPLMIWAFSDSFTKPRQSNDERLLSRFASVSFLVVGEVWIVVGTLFKNNVPCNYVLSCRRRSSELVFSLTMSLSKGIVLMGSESQNHGSRYAISILSDLVILAGSAYVLALPTYWNIHFSILQTSLGFILGISKLVLDIKTDTRLRVYIMIPLLLFPPVYKLVAVVFGIRQKYFDLGDSTRSITKINSLDKLVLLLTVYNQPAIRNPDINREAAIQARGYLAQYRSWNERCVHKPVERLSSVIDFVYETLESDERHFPKNVRLYLKLLAQLYKVSPNMIEVSLLLRQLFDCHDSSLFALFDAYHFRKLFECKLYQIYRGKIKDEEFERIFEKDIYEDFSVKLGSDPYLSSVESKASRVDIRTALQSLEIYHESYSRVFEELSLKQQLFLNNESEVLCRSSNLYKLQSKILETHLRITQTSRYLNFTTQFHHHASYIYPIFIYYYSVVRNCIRLAEHILSLYKRVLMRILVSHKGFSRLKPRLNPSDPSSVVIQAAIHKERLGELLDITPNYVYHLGFASNGVEGVKGRNISIFLPEQFYEQHLKALESYDQYPATITAEGREVFVRRFDGYVKRAFITVKVIPSLTEFASAITLLSFREINSLSMALVDEEMNIINAERRFWDYFDVHQPAAQVRALRVRSGQGVLAAVDAALRRAQAQGLRAARRAGQVERVRRHPLHHPAGLHLPRVCLQVQPSNQVLRLPLLRPAAAQDVGELRRGLLRGTEKHREDLC